jgi:membrane protein YqaA with SNARE-associated domain
MLRRLYDWTMSLAARTGAARALAIVAFIESSVFPIPPDVLQIPMVLARRDRAWFYAAIATVASVLGGIAGYLIGWLVFDTVGRPLLEFYGYAEKFDDFAARYNHWGAWIVFIAGVTPFPYKVITIASGATGLSMPVFMVASVAARGLRFFIVSALLYWFGPPIRAFIERYLGLLAIVFVVLLLGGFALVKYVL